MRFDRQRGSDLSRLLGGLKQANDLKSPVKSVFGVALTTLYLVILKV